MNETIAAILRGSIWLLLLVTVILAAAEAVLKPNGRGAKAWRMDILCETMRPMGLDDYPIVCCRLGDAVPCR